MKFVLVSENHLDIRASKTGEAQFYPIQHYCSRARLYQARGPCPDIPADSAREGHLELATQAH